MLGIKNRLELVPRYGQQACIGCLRLGATLAIFADVLDRALALRAGSRVQWLNGAATSAFGDADCFSIGCLYALPCLY